MKKKRTLPDRIVLLASLFLFGALLWFSFRHSGFPGQPGGGNVGKVCGSFFC